MLTVAGATVARAAADDDTVHVIQISGPIDLALAPYLDRTLADAEQAGARAVLLEVDTPGGRLDAVLQMQSALVDAPVRTVAFVNRTALSAGALVTIASEDIFMAPGSTLGAATPVVGGSGRTADEKTVSAVRGTFGATAQARGRDPRIAEAMVDPDIAIEGLSEPGELLTLTAEQAVQYGYAQEIVADRAAVLDAAGLAGTDIVETAPAPAESFARFLTNPVVASLLVTLALLLLIADLAIGGIGITSGIAVACFALFFWGHLLAGLAGWEEIALVAVGIVLIGLELLVIPGFGVAGLLGLAAVLGGLFIAQISRDLVTPDQIQRAAVSVGATFVAVIVGLVLTVRYLVRHGPPHALVLDTQLGSGEPVTERATGGWVRWFGGEDLVLAGGSGTDGDDGGWDDEPPFLGGRRGVALSPLRPSGIAEIDGDRIDVITSGEYVPAGEQIEVVDDTGYRRIVRRLPDDTAGQHR
jgi:membrane-bound serine protease (ClpP class)